MFFSALIFLFENMTKQINKDKLGEKTQQPTHD